MVVSRAGEGKGGGNGKLMFNGHRVSAGERKSAVDGGNEGCTTM